VEEARALGEGFGVVECRVHLGAAKRSNRFDFVQLELAGTSSHKQVDDFEELALFAL